MIKKKTASYKELTNIHKSNLLPCYSYLNQLYLNSTTAASLYL